MSGKEDYYQKVLWPKWINDIKISDHHTILLHGIMGSELVDEKKNGTVWLDLEIGKDIDYLEFASLEPGGGVDIYDQSIYARSVLNPPLFIPGPYDKFLRQVGPGKYCYDWRESIPIEAGRLILFLRKLFDDGFKEKVNFVTHSMGGCLLLWMLRETKEFDDRIKQIIFVAPPFHGALKPLQVLEYGNGIPVDILVNNGHLRRSVATMPGLFDLLVAPQDAWVTDINIPWQHNTLQPPVRTETDIYSLSCWKNHERWNLRNKILNFTRKYHEDKFAAIPTILARFNKLSPKVDVNVIVGLNGKTHIAAEWNDDSEWTIYTSPTPPDGKYSNGDGTVLFQSSILPGLPAERYWAFIPKWPGGSPMREDTHGDLLKENNVIQGVLSLLGGSTPDQLEPYNIFAPNIDLAYELAGDSTPKPCNFDYIDRAHWRGAPVVNPVVQNLMNPWDKNMNKGDAQIYYATREAAINVLKNQADLKTEATRVGVTPDFLENHLKRMMT
ncbi:MAG: hypothetical protein HQK59_16285, partial [Deltaproteobacteria bacterium]|nr:hypothetical protein [Deltaproteobacteria bacterium]